jgi:hypothetical protein
MIPQLERFGMSTDAYLDAKNAFDQADRAITALHHRLGRVAAALEHSRGFFAFSNVEGSGFPPETIMGRQSVSDDGNTWPSARAINQALMDWHRTKQAMDNAWAAVPQDRKAGLVPPPSVRR